MFRGSRQRSTSPAFGLRGSIRFDKESTDVAAADTQVLEQFADDLITAAHRALRDGRPFPQTDVVGYGNKRSLLTRQPDTKAARQRAEAVAKVINDRLWARAEDMTGFVAPDLEPRGVHGSGERHGADKADQRAAEFTATPMEATTVMGSPQPDPQPVPRALHTVWLNAPIREASQANIRNWVERAGRAGWTMTVWTDDAGWNNNRAFFERLQRASGVIRNVNAALPDREGPTSRQLLAFFNGQQVWTAASDIIRYHVLLGQGGFYVDSDVGPGTVDLRPTLPPMSRRTLPLLGPDLRDHTALDRTNLTIRQLGSRVPADREPLPTPPEYQWRQGRFNQQFAGGPPGMDFWQQVIDALPSVEDVRSRLEGVDRTRVLGAAAQLTGPTFLRKYILEFLGNPREALGGFRIGLFRTDDVAVRYWRGVEWVTADSDVHHKVSPGPGLLEP